MKLTVFTPAYNRSNTLPRLYESLLGQSCHDFEWLIIDDGSTDGTAETVKGFTGEGKFPVRYIYKENGGKHTAYNLALEEVRGDWFLCVDSDDLLAETAVADILAAAQGNMGLIAYKEDLQGRRLSGEFPGELDRATLWELNEQHGCRGEFTLAFRTDYARQFPFPVFVGERFIGECVVYDRMTAQFGLLPKTVTVCEYQPDGYSSQFSRLMKCNPNGYCLYYLQRIDLVSSWKARLITAGRYWCFRYISGNQALVYRGKHRLTAALGAGLGLAFRLYYKLLRGI